MMDKVSLKIGIGAQLGNSAKKVIDAGRQA
jgi:hypothetical protein